MEIETAVYQQLHKLSAIKTQRENLESLLRTLWKTRKRGLSPAHKSSLQSLLNLPSPAELASVLACLRSLIRKCVNENFTSDDMVKLFPPELPLDLQTSLILSLQKYQNQWKVETSREQNLLPKSVPHQINAGLLPSFSSLPSSDICASSWPRQQEFSINRFNQNDFGASTPINTEFNSTAMASVATQLNMDRKDNLGILPRLKSITWTLENRSKAPSNRVAIITLKLQDYMKSPTGETEVKFEVTRDTLEVMLKSMVCISEQLTLVQSSTEPLQKKQKQ